jgi:hypothetical protein
LTWKSPVQKLLKNKKQPWQKNAGVALSKEAEPSLERLLDLTEGHPRQVILVVAANPLLSSVAYAIVSFLERLASLAALPSCHVNLAYIYLLAPI